MTIWPINAPKHVSENGRWSLPVSNVRKNDVHRWCFYRFKGHDGAFWSNTEGLQTNLKQRLKPKIEQMQVRKTKYYSSPVISYRDWFGSKFEQVFCRKKTRWYLEHRKKTDYFSVFLLQAQVFVRSFTCSCSSLCFSSSNRTDGVGWRRCYANCCFNVFSMYSYHTSSSQFKQHSLFVY